MAQAPARLPFYPRVKQALIDPEVWIFAAGVILLRLVVVLMRRQKVQVRDLSQSLYIFAPWISTR
jgi:hypothetical protein